MKRLLFVDDDAFFSMHYKRELSVVFEVFAMHEAEGVVAYLNDNPDVSVLVLDVMMPPPPGVEPHIIRNGVDTGLWVLERILEECHVWPFPIILLTNRGVPDIEEELQKRSISRKWVTVCHKAQTLAREFPIVAREWLEKARGRSGR